MKLINIFRRKERATPRISLSGKLEAIIGHYYLSGVGVNNIETLYYDPSASEYDSIIPSKANTVAYFLKNESMALVRKDMLDKLKAETKEYNIKYIPIKSFEEEFLNKALLESHLDCTQDIEWVDDDFMNDDTIEFDFDAFEIIDSGVTYLNPNHFSVEQLISVLNG